MRLSPSSAIGCILLISCSFYNSSCNRQTKIKQEEDLPVENKKMKPEITEGDPFLNQPDLLCTIIRPLSAFEYDPNNGKAGAEKYCLLDICLQDENNSTGVLNIGDEAASVNVTYQLIKVFETVEEAKAYALKYAIQDVAF